METAKQKAIREAYGEYWDKVKNNLTDSYWFKSKEVLGDFANTHIRARFPNIEWECMNNYHSVYCYYFRPKSINGIETNNGWNILDRNSVFPDISKVVLLFDNGEILDYLDENLPFAIATHWREKLEYPKPIY